MDHLRLLTFSLPLAVGLAAGCEPPPAAIPASEAVDRLRGYLELDTSNPPGGERLAIDFLDRQVAGTGIEVTHLDAGDDRPSWFGLLPATTGEAAPVLLLVHHIDVVPAGEGWRHPPFGGALIDGEVWGRGAIDTKGLGVAHLEALLELERSGAPRHRAVALLASADEETGGALGVGRWLDRRGELFAPVAAVLNEGGVNRGFRGRLHWWGVETTQKRPLWLDATAADTGALVSALARLVDRPLTWRVTDTSRRIFAGLAPYYNEHWRQLFGDLESAIGPDGPRRGLLPGMATYFVDSVQVNQLERLADRSARATIDARLLPETDSERFLNELRTLLGPEVTLTVRLEAPPVDASPFQHPLLDLMRSQLGSEAPVVEQMIAGVTDSRHFRERGIPTFGFSPFVLDPELTATVHARNERIPVAAFEDGVARMKRLVADWAAGAGTD